MNFGIRPTAWGKATDLEEWRCVVTRGPSNAPAGVGYKKTENYNSELTGIVSFLDKGPAYCGPQW